MRALPAMYRALEVYAGGGPRPDLDELARLTGPSLFQADEHTVACTLLLSALCGRLDGGSSIAAGLLTIARNYEEASFLYTGRIMPRFKEMIELLDRAVDERDPATLVEVADHLSQGWSAYPTTVFPTALARLAAELGFQGGTEAFATTSFTIWRRALEVAAEGRPDLAAPLFQDSLARYRHYLYHADASWLFTDIVISQLTQRQDEAAAATVEEQAQYVAEVLAHYPAAADQPPVFQLGEIQSGGYSTFVESVTLRPRALAEQDRAILRRYLRISSLLTAACRYRSERDFTAALDMFSFGWTSFSRSPYPPIFQHLAHRLGWPSKTWNSQLTAYVCWHHMLRSAKVSPTSQHLIDIAVGLHDRLGYAGMDKQASIALLDAAVIHGRLHGTGATVEWIGRRTRKIRTDVPDLLRAAVDCLQSQSEQSEPPDEAALHSLASYNGLRSRHAVPPLVLEFPVRRGSGGSVRVEVALYDRLLSIEGITVYEQTPEPLIQILRVLGDEFTLHRAQGSGDVPPLSAAELATRTGTTSSALAQCIRRFRGASQDRFRQATTFALDPDTVIQGRPGYRINPARIESFQIFSGAR